MRANARLTVLLGAALALGAGASAATAASHKAALRGRHHESDDGGSKSKSGRKSRHEAAETKASAHGRRETASENEKPCSRWEIRHHRCEAVAATEPSRRTASRGRSGGREAITLLAPAAAPAAVARVEATPPVIGPPPLKGAVVLEDGQSLADVAARAGVSVKDLAALNGVSVSDDLPTGTTVKLPPGAGLGAGVGAGALAQETAPSRATTPIAPPSATAGGPRAYATLGPGSATPVAPARTGRWSRTEADALAAYQVASTRAPSLSGRADSTHNRFVWPLKGAVASGYGAHGMGQRNEGLDFAARPGDAVRAAAAGEVVYAGKEIAGVGNLVLLKHADGWVTAYSHLGRVTVAMRQTVEQGQEVAEAGKGEGDAAPPVHFEVRQPGAGGAKPVDPSTVLPARGEGATGQG